MDVLESYLEKASYKDNFEHAITDKSILEIMGVQNEDKIDKRAN